MRVKLAMTFLLLLLLLGQIVATVAMLREDPLAGLIPEASMKTDEPAKSAAAVKMVRLQPSPPDRLPDFNQGYIFNAERSFKTEGEQAEAGVTVGNVDIGKVQYAGSIITETISKALLNYSAAGQVAPRGRSPMPQQRQGFLQVEVGDTVGGYKVTEILPGKIVFSRNGEKIEKPLYDKNKERAMPQHQPAVKGGVERKEPRPATPDSLPPAGMTNGGPPGAAPVEGANGAPQPGGAEPEVQRSLPSSLAPALQQKPPPYPVPGQRPMVIPGKTPGSPAKSGNGQ